MSQKDKKPYIMQIDSILWNTHALKTTPIKEGAPSARSQGPGASALEPMLVKLRAGVKLWQQKVKVGRQSKQIQMSWNLQKI